MKSKVHERVVIILRNPGYFRNIEWIVRNLLFVRHVELLILIGGFDKRVGDREFSLLTLKQRYPQIQFEKLKSKDGINRYGQLLKYSLDNLAFAKIGNSKKDPAIQRVSRKGTYVKRLLLKLVMRFHISKTEVQDRFLEFSQNQKAADMDLTTIIKFNPTQVVLAPAVSDNIISNLALALRKFKIPTIGIVISWDNLTIKGAFVDLFDKVICWSNRQIYEISQFHEINPGDRFFSAGCYSFAHRFLKDEIVFENDIPQSANLTSPISFTWFTSSGFIANSSKSNEEEIDLILQFLNIIKLKKVDLLKDFKLRIRLHPHDANSEEYKKRIINAIKENHLEESIVLDDAGEPLGSTKRNIYEKVLSETLVGIGLATTSIFELGMSGKPSVSPPGELADRCFEQMTHGKYLLRENGGPILRSLNWSDFLDKLLQEHKYRPSGIFEDCITPRLNEFTLSAISNEILTTKLVANSRTFQRRRIIMSRVFLFLLLVLDQFFEIIKKFEIKLRIELNWLVKRLRRRYQKQRNKLRKFSTWLNRLWKQDPSNS